MMRFSKIALALVGPCAAAFALLNGEAAVIATKNADVPSVAARTPVAAEPREQSVTRRTERATDYFPHQFDVKHWDDSPLPEQF
jgi:hypothetical protein